MTSAVAVASRTSNPGPTRRTRLLISCASVALAAATLAPQKAEAQAFSGTPITATGTVTYSRATPGVETITVGTSTATINWSPTDTAIGGGAITFLPNGNTATFTSASGVTDYTVLNRIVPNDPNRPISLNGHIISTLQGTSATGGKVWFYSPGGIVVGATAVFDVGGLLLSTADLPGFSANATGFSFATTGTTNPNSSIQIASGAQINALQQNSYIALVAPRIEQGGTVKVDGSAAFVAAEQLTMTMNQGLFDIQVDVGGGTTNAQGIVHSGSTIGGSTAALSANHRVYMVAVPKNQALTMLLGGTIGFDANVAGYDNGKIVLSSGYNLNDLSGNLQRGNVVDQPGGIEIGPGTYLSDLVAISNGSINVGAGAGNIDFKGDLALNSYDAWDAGTITLGASNGNTLNVDGDVSLYSANPLFQPATQLKLLADPGSSILIGGNLGMTAQFYPGYGGSAKIDAFGGTIAIGGVVTVNVNGIDDPAINYGDQRHGGTIDISSTDNLDDQGSITATGMSLSANAVGHNNTGVEDWQLVDATGGTINVNTGDGGEILVNGNFSATAGAIAGQQSTIGLVGGEARGGDIHLGNNGGTLHITGDVAMNADGAGGSGAVGIDGGASFGGYAEIYSVVNPGSVIIDGGVSLSAGATGGNGQNGGAARGGVAGVYANSGEITLGASTNASAVAHGGNASVGFGGMGGNARGGITFIEAAAQTAQGFSVGTVSGGDAILDVSAIGGAGGAGNGDNTAAGAGGEGRGGFLEEGDPLSGGAFALAQDDGGTLTLGNVTMFAQGFGGDGGLGGNGQPGGSGGGGFGGLAQAGGFEGNNGRQTAGSSTFGNLDLRANGGGGAGGAGVAGQGNGGNAEGGIAVINAKGDVHAISASLAAWATGGNGSTGGNGLGGLAIIEAYSGNSAIFTGDVTLNASAGGGNGSSGSGGNGTGGDAEAQATNAGAVLTISGTTTATANGTGGSGPTAGGNGLGGIAGIHAGVDNSTVGGTATFASALVQANGIGGTGPTGGTGTGGDAHAGSRGGSFTLTGTLTGEASGFGGSGLAVGGTGQGGQFLIAANFSEDVTASTTDIHIANVQAFGFGGNGGSGAAGGQGSGGRVTIQSATSNSSLSIDDLDARVVGRGGDGGNGATGGAGGDGTGGAIVADIHGDATTGNIILRANGFGGNGGSGVDGGRGGNGSGGTSTITIYAGGSLASGSIENLSRGFGGDGGNGTTGLGGDGGDALGGTNFLTVEAGSTLTAASYIGSSNAPSGFDIDPATNELASFGGNGGTGAAGTGAGGSGTSGSNNGAYIGGTATTTGLFVVTAFARGGDGSTGGAATAGSSSIVVDGTLTAGGTVQASAQAQGGDGAVSGGVADAGTASITVNGTLNAAQVNVLNNATGGTGSQGGGATAGSATLSVAGGGSMTVTGATSIQAVGRGGDGTSSGGDGTGGFATFDIASGVSANLGTSTGVTADGFGGNATSGTGGFGSGNWAQLTSEGTLIATGSTFISAEGEGGDGSAGGGGGSGGAAELLARNGGTVQLGTVSNVEAEGTGGDSSGGTGGDGTGGFAHLAALDGGSLTGTGVSVNAGGQGGQGIDGGQGSGGVSGEGGGGAIAEANGIDASLTLTGQTFINSAGAGGDGSSGAGGDGFGGFAELVAANGGSATVGNTFVNSGSTGGTGGSGSGSGTGGHALLLATGGSLSGAAMVVAADASATGGLAEIASENGGDLQLASLEADSSGSQAAGQVRVGVAYGSSADLGTATLISTGGGASGSVVIDVGAGVGANAGDILFANAVTITSDGTIDFISRNGAGFNVTNGLNATAAGLITLDDLSSGAVLTAMNVDLDGANILFDWLFNAVDIAFTVDGDYLIGALPFASNSFSLTAGGNVSTAGALSFGSNLFLDAAGNLTAGAITAGGDLSVDAGGALTTGNLSASGIIDLDAVGDIVFGNVSADDFDFDTLGSVTGGNIDVLNHVGGEAQGAIELGDISAGPGVSIDDDFSVGIFSATSITVGDVSGVAPVGFATFGDLVAGDLSAGDLVMLLVGGDIDVGSIATGSAARVYLADSSMFITGGGSVNGGENFDPNAVLALDPVATGGSITIGGPVTTGRLQAATDTGLTIGDVSAGQSVTLAAGGLADFRGTVSSPTITVTSGDINIADGASLGVHGVTTLLTLNAVSDAAPVVIGDGATAPGQYQLAEDGDIFANAVVVNAGDADVWVLDGEIEGSQTAAGGVGSVTLNSGGSVLVRGQVNFINAGADDSLTINAGDAIQVITNAGGISMTDANGDLAGTLELTAHDIWVADQATLDQIAADPTFANAENLLSVNNGPVDPEGKIQVGALAVTMLGSSLLVQNTGTSEELAGLTVGQGGLTIVNGGGEPATVIIYGHQETGDGSVVTGDAFLDGVQFSGSGGFSDGSAVNGCEVGAGCEPPVPPQSIPGAESILGPVGLVDSPADIAASDTASSEESTDEESTDDEDSDAEGDSGFDPTLGLINAAPLSRSPPIEEPVTSGSDGPVGPN